MRSALVLAVVALSGCHTVGDFVTCSGIHDPARERACRQAQAQARDAENEQAEREQRRLDHEQDLALSDRDAYRAAKTPCEQGDARACLTVALYEDRHGAPAPQVEARYRLACVRGVARACYFAGARAPALDQAAASFVHGCELGDGESCFEAWQLDQAKTSLLGTACELHYRETCRLYRELTDTSFLR